MSVILLVDDHSSRNGLKKLLEASLPHCRVVETSKLPHSGIDETFNLILIDSGSLGYGTLEILAEWREARPITRFAVFSGTTTRAEALHFLSAGFHGFFHKLQSKEELVAGIRDLLLGRIYIPGSVIDAGVDSKDFPLRDNAEQETLKLTRRQNEVLALLARGMSNKEIARELKIAEGTSKIHTAALLRAIGARNRTEAAFKGARYLGSRRHAAGSQDEVPEFQRRRLDQLTPRKKPTHLKSYRKSGKERVR